jgi:tetraprenyl-beta-curcumene synthase
MRLAVRAGLALLLANARYWRGVAPTVRRQLAGWQRAALAIPEPTMRDAALSKLRAERFNVELAATLATIACRRQRVRTTIAIVALQVSYDYLDLLTESPACAQHDATRLLGRLCEAVGAQAAAPPGHAYLDCLLGTVAGSLERLPAARVVRPVAIGSVERCVEGQALGHAALDGAGEARLRRWAKRRAKGGPLGWREHAAGASASVLCLHALIAAASAPSTTAQDALKLDRLYLSIGALTMLDSVVDREQDAIGGQWGHLGRYPDAETMAMGLAGVAHGALAETDAVPHGAHHAMTLGGVIAYYASAPEVAGPPAHLAVQRLRLELGLLLAPTLAFMRMWRTAKRTRPVRGPAPEIVMTVAPQRVSSIAGRARTDRAGSVLGR